MDSRMKPGAFFPPVVVFMGLISSWRFVDQIGRGKTPRLAGVALRLRIGVEGLVKRFLTSS